MSYYPVKRNSPNGVFKKYASQLHRKNLTTKLKNLAEINQITQNNH